jgi:hypothetical protein
VVDLLTVDARGYARHDRVVGCRERRDPDRVGCLVEHVACDRRRPVHPAELDEGRASVLVERPVVRERVCSGAELLGDDLVERAGVADLVLRDRGERDVLLEERRDPGPLRVPPADDQLVVRQREEDVSPRRCRHALGPP